MTENLKELVLSSGWIDLKKFVREVQDSLTADVLTPAARESKELLDQYNRGKIAILGEVIVELETLAGRGA